jgi:iron complex transport system permease protein
MKGRVYVLLIGLLLVFFLIALGFPHGNDSWFAYWFSSVNDRVVQYKLLTVFRIPELVMAIISGTALAVCGLLLQTFLNNPLAGPSILGLTSGSNLLVASALMGGSFFSIELSSFSITFSAALGAFIFGLIIVLVAMRIKSTVSLLLIGLMLGTFVSAVTSLLITQADATSVKRFSLWAFGTLKQVNMEQLPFVMVVFFIGIVAAFLLAKPLNAFVLGEQNAALLGISIPRFRWQLLLVVSLLTGLITAFCGPIAFVGLIVPNCVKLFAKTANHKHLVVMTALSGALFMLLCVIIVRILEPYIVLPINTLTSLLGAPVVLVLLLKKVRYV